MEGDSMKVDLSIIIVSFNTKDITIDCINSVIKTVKKISYEIIVVDNNSQDDSVESIQNLKFKIQNDNSKFKIIKNNKNEGFSKANNMGVKNARGRYVLFLNSDTVVYENTLDSVIEFMDNHEKVGAVTCYVEMPDGKLDDAAHRGFPTPFRALSHFSGLSKLFPRSKLFSGYSLGWMDLSKTHEIEALAGAFMLVRREAGEEIGWWDEDFFWYGEDLDFCYRLKEKGWKIYFVPHYKILHLKGVSGGIKKVSENISKATHDTKKKATRARFEAMRIFYKKHYINKYPKVVTALVFSGIGLKEWFTRNSK